jgi:ACR3 family arsenite transporter
VGASPTAPAPWCLVDGIKMLEVPLWRSYLAGCILLGIAPCTAMVLVWGYLARGMTA